jgi:hypothetical protein
MSCPSAKSRSVCRQCSDTHVSAELAGPIAGHWWGTTGVQSVYLVAQPQADCQAVASIETVYCGPEVCWKISNGFSRDSPTWWPLGRAPDGVRRAFQTETLDSAGLVPAFPIPNLEGARPRRAVSAEYGQQTPSQHFHNRSALALSATP